MRHTFVFLSLFAVFASSIEYRSFDGTGNNVNNPSWGSANTPLLRYGNMVTYADGLSQPTPGLPNPREVSNKVFGATNSSVQPRSEKGLSDFATYWGQFIDHDMTLTPTDPTSTEFINISIPACDPYFDPYCTGNKSIPMRRSVHIMDPITGRREQVNRITSFLDGSNVYGASLDRANMLRSFQGGKLRTSVLPGLGNETFPPTGDPTMENNARVVPTDQLFVTGDIRGNENPGLLALQTIFMREHNRWATELAALNSTWDDETLYQEARRRVVALIQYITVHEYMPVILGMTLPTYTGYNASQNPSIFTEFSTAAFRYGHSEVNTHFLRLEENGTETAGGHLPLRLNYYNPASMSEGLSPILRGMASQAQLAVDSHFVDDLRNFLFGPPGSGGMDLVAINTQRSRDHGLPLFNEVRRMFGLPVYTAFSQITSDPALAAALADVYQNDVDSCELYVCGLAETHPPMSNIGETFRAVLLEQYRRVRDGDRFWFENDQFTQDELIDIKSTTLAMVILRNTDINYMQCFVMNLPDGCLEYAPKSDPTTTSSSGTTTSGEAYDYLVTVMTKTPAHPFYGMGDTFGYVVDGVEGRNLTLEKTKTYKFKVNVGCTHELYISRSAQGHGSGYMNTGVTNAPACNNGILTFTPPSDLPYTTLYYACTNHDFMGYTIDIIEPRPVPPPTTTGGTAPCANSASCAFPMDSCLVNGTCDTNTGTCLYFFAQDGTQCTYTDTTSNVCYQGLCKLGTCGRVGSEQLCSEKKTSDSTGLTQLQKQHSVYVVMCLGLSLFLSFVM